MTEREAPMVCPQCGQAHAAVALRRGERALCARCGTVMARRSRCGRDTPLALAVCGLVLAVPACVMPFVTVGRFGSERISVLTSGAGGLWDHGMQVLGGWVLFCGSIGPILLLALLAGLLLCARSGRHPALQQVLERIAHAVQDWAMPEVHVLGVLVAFFKLGDVVSAAVGPGLWCYAAMALAMLAAWNGYRLQPRPAGAEVRS